MRGLLITIVLVLVFALIGWISFRNSDSAATISIDKQEIKADTQEAAESVKEATEDAVDATKRAFEDADSEIEQLDDAEIDRQDENETVPPAEAAS